MDKEIENTENFDNIPKEQEAPQIADEIDSLEFQEQEVHEQEVQEENYQEEIENFKEQTEVDEIKSAPAVELVAQEESESDLITVRPVKFQEFEPVEPVRTIKKNLDIMQDVQMHVSVELGKSKLSIKEVMEMEKGSIVELDKIAGEQVEIYVNKKLVARGEVIVIEDKFGVRVVSTNLPKTTI